MSNEIQPSGFKDGLVIGLFQNENVTESAPPTETEPKLTPEPVPEPKAKSATQFGPIWLSIALSLYYLLMLTRR